MNKNKEIALRILDLENNKIKLDYNIISRGSQNGVIKSRCKNFAIYHKGKDCGLLIEYIKQRLIISTFTTPDTCEELDLSEISRRMPMRYREIIAKIIKYPEGHLIHQEFLKEIIEECLRGIPSNKYSFLKYHDSSNGIILLTYEELLNDKEKHTFIYQDLPFFGKNNTHFRASIKRRIGSINEIIDMGK